MWIVAIIGAGIAFAFVLPGWGKLIPIITVGAIIWAHSQVQKGFDKAGRNRRR